jgi:hypothetical protein
VTNAIRIGDPFAPALHEVLTPGEDYVLSLLLLDDLSSPEDLSGCGAEYTLKETYADPALLGFSSSVPDPEIALSGGAVTVTIGAAAGLALLAATEARHFVFDVFFTDAAGAVSRLARGNLRVESTTKGQ